MRLTSAEVVAIKDAAAATFGSDAVVRLFGSRTRDDLRGGDIDLHVEVADTDAAEKVRSLFVSQLHRTIGERSIDVLIQGSGQLPGKLDLAARRTGIVL